jgi:hypothetical protein
LQRSRHDRAAGLDHAARQRGGALLVVLTLLVLASAAVLLDQLGSGVSSRRSARAGDARMMLAQAKAALIGWSVSHPDTPGRLPFPDRDGDNNYDGVSDCRTAINPLTPGLLIGLFPLLGEGGSAPLNSGGICTSATNWSLGIEHGGVATEPLLYAVSANLVQDEALVNPRLIDAPTHPWLTVRDATGAILIGADGNPLRVAAVIIDPGPPLPNQQRDPAVDPTPTVAQYLDVVTVGATYNNADFSGCLDDAEGGCTGTTFAEDFIQYPDADLTPTALDAFNDILVYITADELLRAVERRALAEAATNLARFADADGDGVPDRSYPWMSPYEDPRTVRGVATAGAATTLTDALVADFAAEGVSPGDVVVNLGDDSSAVVTAAAGSTVTFAGALSGGEVFDVGEAYAIRPPFDGVWGTREGHLPMADAEAAETRDLYTPFAVAWLPPPNVVAIKPPLVNDPPVGVPGNLLYQTPGDKAAVQALWDAAAIPASPFAVPPPSIPPLPPSPPGAVEGTCGWSSPGQVDCEWAQTVDTGVDVNFCTDSDADTICDFANPPPTDVWRRTSVQVAFAGTPSLSAASDVLARDVVAATPAALPGFVKVTDYADVAGTEYVIGEITIDAPDVVAAALTVSGIRLDPVDWDETDAPFPALDGLVIQDAYPQWLVENEWHHFLYVKLSADHVSGAPRNCVANGNCIALDNTVGGDGVRTDLQAVVVSSGPAFVTDAGGNPHPLAQDRTLGAMTDYFEDGNAILPDPEGGNARAGNERARRDPVASAGLATDFNDQTRATWPPCPGVAVPGPVSCRP